MDESYGETSAYGNCYFYVFYFLDTKTAREEKWRRGCPMVRPGVDLGYERNDGAPLAISRRRAPRRATIDKLTGKRATFDTWLLIVGKKDDAKFLKFEVLRCCDKARQRPSIV
jgi:hypothetical protein